uniref:Conotoxin Im016 n=1 Tax=Conus imperialis TaxID=35631 RepID=CNG_CONIM|nr:RecName: Full=Conotoxin Im016; AltName: Full=Conopeptide im016; Flags: Precursor [Conus imperialis]AME17674.1 conopeptide im016 [Conus imperialis]
MSTLGMMLLILLLLVPLATFADDGPTMRGHRSAKLLAHTTRDSCPSGTNCPSKICCNGNCCSKSSCRCETNQATKERVCVC